MKKARISLAGVLTTAVLGAVVALAVGGRHEALPGRSFTAPPAQTVSAAEEDQLPSEVAIGQPSTDHAAVGSPAPEPVGQPVSEQPVFGPVHELVALGDQPPPPPAAPAEPLGAVSLSGHAPDGLDFGSIPGLPPAATTTGLGGPAVLSAGPGCHLQCITSGVAYPRGFGAELVVTTNVPATIFVSVIADTDGGGGWDFDEYTVTVGMVTEVSWALDHLEPGQTYYAMAAATDEHDHTSHAWGEFTTLAERSMLVSYGDVEVWGGPDNVVSSSFSQRVDGERTEIGSHKAPVERVVDLSFRVFRRWNAACTEEAWAGPSSPVGHDVDHCATWNTAWIDDLDLDAIPAGKTRWASTTVQAAFHTPTGAGQALPADFSEPFEISFIVPVTVYVTYS